MDPLVSTDWLAGELGADDLRVYETTVFLRRDDQGALTIEPGRDEWENGHIPSTGFLDLMTDLSDPDAPYNFTAPAPEVLAETLGSLGIGPETRVVFYDRAHTMWATRAWWMLRSIGLDNVAVLDGGWKAWTTDGRASSPDPAPTFAPVEFTAKPQPRMLVTSDEVQAASTNDGVCLINALSSDQHRGDDLTYGKPGHIASATNVFAVDLLDPETGRYRPLDELRQVFAGAGVGEDRIITYCGGGIAATSDAFVLTLLGHDDIGIYDGSLREWIDLGLPLEV